MISGDHTDWSSTQGFDVIDLELTVLFISRQSINPNGKISSKSLEPGKDVGVPTVDDPVNLGSYPHDIANLG